jgi:hypothetical protein
MIIIVFIMILFPVVDAKFLSSFSKVNRKVKLPAPRGGASLAQLKEAVQALALTLYDALYIYQ